MTPNPLQIVQKLLVSLCDGPGMLEGFAVQWLGPDYRPVGWTFAVDFAEKLAGVLERMGMLRDPLWWDALVLIYPLKSEDIRAVEQIFRPSPIYVQQPPTPTDPATRRPPSSGRMLNDGGRGVRFMRAFEDPILQVMPKLSLGDTMTKLSLGDTMTKLSLGAGPMSSLSQVSQVMDSLSKAAASPFSEITEATKWITDITKVAALCRPDPLSEAMRTLTSIHDAYRRSWPFPEEE